MAHPTFPALTALAVGVLGLAAPASAQSTSYPPMLRGDTAATDKGWDVTALVTVGDSGHGYTPTGIFDGLGAFPGPRDTVWVLVNSELGAGVGYPFSLANGTTMTGARVHAFQLRRSRSGAQVVYDVLDAKPAFDAVYDRAYQPVSSPAQLNETGHATDGISRLCSAQAVQRGTYGFVDAIFFTGEETSKPYHPHGGTEFALDVVNGELWAVPAMGRMAWENVTPLETGDPGTVALLCGDDDEANPLYLYVGTKGAAGDGSFLDRNGLRVGRLYAWKADNGDTNPNQFFGQHALRTGSWVEMTVRDVNQAGQPGYDAQGYADMDTLHDQADALGCFDFSRPEDLATNPFDGSQAVFTSTGRGSLYAADNWGVTCVVDVDFVKMTADIAIIQDADGLAIPDEGVRSPDNIEWARDGKIYAQEDRSTSPSALFGAATGIEASVWQIDPITRIARRIAEIDRSAVAPLGATDPVPGDIGNWETSGVLDVTEMLPHLPGERLLLATVQAHSVKDGPIGGSANLVEGGQLVILSHR